MDIAAWFSALTHSEPHAVHGVAPLLSAGRRALWAFLSIALAAFLPINLLNALSDVALGTVAGPLTPDPASSDVLMISLAVTGANAGLVLVRAVMYLSLVSGLALVSLAAAGCAVLLCLQAWSLLWNGWFEESLGLLLGMALGAFVVVQYAYWFVLPGLFHTI